MPDTITETKLTIRGRVNRRVVKVFVGSTEITLAADKTFAHQVTASKSDGGSLLVTFTTIDSNGLSESRPVHIATTFQNAPPLAPSAPV
jgi:hypothetical protein